MNRRFVLAALIASLFVTAATRAAGADTMRKYAVISLIGDKLTVVTYVPQTGSMLSTNRRDSFPVADAVFDKTALRAVDEALTTADDKASITLLGASSQTLFEDGATTLSAGSRAVLPEEVAAAAAESHATHLVILTKYRSEALLRSETSKVGSGKLEGLGFYVDHVHAFKRSDTGERGIGFLAPFVYMKVSLIDLATRSVLSEEVVTESTTLSAARNQEGADPWNALTAPQKVDVLRDMIEREVARVIPILVKAVPRSQ